MTNKEINVAIAEHLGWSWYAVEKADWYYRQGGHGYTNRIEEAGRYTKGDAEKELVTGEPMRIVRIPHPHYADDLNAMHEAEKTLSDERYLEFTRFLMDECQEFGRVSRHSSASAEQRAECFLRAIGKWKETQ